MTRSLARIALCWLALPAAIALAEVRLEVQTDRTTLSLDESLTVQVTVESQGVGAPSVQLPPFEGFQVISQQVQRPMQFSFGFGSKAVVQSSSIYTYVLQPLRAGKLVIKPVRAELDGQVKTSRPIEITVAGGADQPGDQAAGHPDAADVDGARAPATAAHSEDRKDTLDKAEVDSTAFLRAVADKAQPYEGEQVTITIYLYVRERLQTQPNVQTEPTTDGLWTHDLVAANQPQRGERQMVGNSVYAVYVLRRFAAFPLHSGDVTIGPMAIEIDQSSLFDLFGGGARPNLKRASAPLTLRVKPLPAQGRPAGDVAVGRYQLSSKLDRAQAATGDALTLTTIVEGQGNIRTVQLHPPSIPGVDVLQPEIKDLVEAPKDVVSGRREYRFLVVPRAPGRVSIPALTLTTFDPRTERYEQRSSEPLVFEAVGKASAAVNSGGNDPQLERVTPVPSDTAHAWAPIRTQSALQRGYRRVVERRFYPFALLAAPLLWLSLVSAAGVRRRLALRAQSGQLRVLRDAEQRLRSAEQAAEAGDAARFYAHASAAVVGVLDARLEQPVTGLTRPQLRALLEARGMDPALIDSVLQALQDCEYARFGSAPLSSAELGSQARALLGFFKQLAAWKPKLIGHATEAA